MTEAELQKAVIERAKARGWHIAHFDTARAMREGGGFYTPQRGNPGFPDLVLLKPPRLLFAELKSSKGRVNFHQQTWLTLLNGIAGVRVYVWTPADWPEEIDRALQ